MVCIKQIENAPAIYRHQNKPVPSILVLDTLSACVMVPSTRALKHSKME